MKRKQMNDLSDSIDAVFSALEMVMKVILGGFALVFLGIPMAVFLFPFVAPIYLYKKSCPGVGKGQAFRSQAIAP